MRYLKRFAELVATPAEGVVEHIVSVFGNVDDGLDRVHPGAFTKTLRENGPQGADRIRATWQHDVWEPIGRPLEMTEVARQDLPPQILSRAPQASGGLRIVTKLSMTTRGRDALTLLQDGVLREWSIGYYPVKSDYGDDGVRNLREVMLVEYALVTLAMNAGALTTALKAAQTYQALPLAPEDTPWDALAAEATVRRWAGGADDPAAMNWERYGKAFVLVDQENPQQRSSYKLQIADIVNGELMAVPRGIFAAAVTLQGGPLREFTEGDIAGAQSHLGQYYTRLERTPPWEREKSLAVEGVVELILSKASPIRPVGLKEFAQDLLRLQAPGARDVWLEQVEQFAAAWAENARLLQETPKGVTVLQLETALAQMRQATAALETLAQAAKPLEKRALTAGRDALARRIALRLAEIEAELGN